MYSEVIHAQPSQAEPTKRRLRRPIRMALEHALAFVRRWPAQQVRKKAAADLMTMPDYLLKDIGISRSQIEAAIWGGSRGR